MRTSLAKTLEDDWHVVRESLRHVSMTMAQAVAMDDSRPLLLRSLLEAILLVAIYIAFLHHCALKWHALSSLSHPFSQVSFIVPAAFTMGYLGFVYFGSRYMRLRKAPVSRRVFECMVVYNLYQTVLNLCCTVAFIREVLRQGMSIWGNQYLYSEDQYHLGFLIWLHYTNTYLELLDTVFIVLRKKFTHISFLHVYQRLLMVWSWFLVCRIACGGDSYFGAVLHCMVRVATYGYFLLALLKLPSPHRESIKRIHITECLLCAVHAIYVLARGTMPAFLAATELFVMLNILVLITDFHYLPKAPSRRSSLNSKPCTVFSFDSSGWLYLYHFGVARYLKEKYLKQKDLADVAFSGASGGSLVAWALCDNAELDVIVEHIISCRKILYYAPWRMMGAVDHALGVFLPADSHRRCSHRLRVLITKVLSRPPFIMGEVATEFVSDKHLTQILRASCHVPLVGGVLPYHVTEGDGGWYYDGLFWSNGLGFVPWRSANHEDKVVRISGLGIWGAQITPQFTIPPWWSLFPPKEDILWGMVEQGYCDAERVLGPKLEQGHPIPERVLKFQEAVYKAWMLAVLVCTGFVSLFLWISL